jgi:hypothetical protein
MSGTPALLAFASGGALLLVEVALGLALISGLLWLAGGRFRGLRASSASTRAIRLTATDSLHVVELEGRRLLVGTGTGAPPRLICELETPRSELPVARVRAADVG